MRYIQIERSSLSHRIIESFKGLPHRHLRHICKVAHVGGTCRRSICRAPAGLPNVNGIISIVLQNLRKRSNMTCMRNFGLGRQSVPVPVRIAKSIVRIFAGRGIRYAHVRCIHSREQRSPGRIGRRACICIGHDDAAFRKLLHIWGIHKQVIGVHFFAVSDAAVEPAIIIHQEKNNVRTLPACLSPSTRRQCQQ